ncbi:MAG: hypothetical protein Q9187_005792 [Circinaria calcarea]
MGDTKSAVGNGNLSREPLFADFPTLSPFTPTPTPSLNLYSSSKPPPTNVCSSSQHLPFQSPQRRITSPHEPNAHPDAQIRPLAPYHPRNRSHVVHLIHTHNESRPANQKGSESSSSDGYPSPVRPPVPIVLCLCPPVEDGMLFEDNSEKTGNPVAHQREEVLKDGKEIVAAAKGAGRIDERADDGPEPAGKMLQTVDDDAAESAKCAETIGACNNECARRSGVGGCPGGIGQGAGGETNAEEVDEGVGKGEAGKGRAERLWCGCIGGIVDVVIRRRREPGDGHREVDGVERKPVRVDGGGVSFGGIVGMESGTSRADEDEQYKNLWEPDPSLGDDDDTNNNGDVTGGDSREDLATDNAVDYTVAEEDDDLDRDGYSDTFTELRDEIVSGSYD